MNDRFITISNKRLILMTFMCLGNEYLMNIVTIAKNNQSLIHLSSIEISFTNRHRKRMVKTFFLNYTKVFSGA